MNVLAEKAVETGSRQNPGKESANKAREELVKISRRIDWRFLLPDPKLERVVCIGEGETGLITALQYFSKSLTIISPAALGDNGSLFDLVVAHSAQAPAVARAKRLLKPGGYLYWEIKRFRKPGFSRQRMVPSQNGNQNNRKTFSRFSHVRAYADYLRELGFKNVEIHWHRPDFRNCKEIILLENPDTLQYVFSRGQGGIAGKLKLLAGKALKASGLLPYLVSSFSLIARKG